MSMGKITYKDFTRNIDSVGIYERARASRETNSLMLFTTPNDSKLGCDVTDLDMFVREIQFGCRWGFAHRNHCRRDIDPNIIPMLLKLRYNEIYYCNYVSVEMPVCFLIVRASEDFCYLLIHDPITNTICYGSIDTDEGCIHTTIHIDELLLIVPQSEVPLFLTAFTKDYGIQQ